MRNVAAGLVSAILLASAFAPAAAGLGARDATQGLPGTTSAGACVVHSVTLPEVQAALAGATGEVGRAAALAASLTSATEAALIGQLRTAEDAAARAFAAALSVARDPQGTVAPHVEAAQAAIASAQRAAERVGGAAKGDAERNLAEAQVALARAQAAASALAARTAREVAGHVADATAAAEAAKARIEAFAADPQGNVEAALARATAELDAAARAAGRVAEEAQSRAAMISDEAQGELARSLDRAGSALQDAQDRSGELASSAQEEAARRIAEAQAETAAAAAKAQDLAAGAQTFVLGNLAAAEAAVAGALGLAGGAAADPQGFVTPYLDVALAHVDAAQRAAEGSADAGGRAAAAAEEAAREAADDASNAGMAAAAAAIAQAQGALAEAESRVSRLPGDAQAAVEAKIGEARGALSEAERSANGAVAAATLVVEGKLAQAQAALTEAQSRAAAIAADPQGFTQGKLDEAAAALADAQRAAAAAARRAGSALTDAIADAQRAVAEAKADAETSAERGFAAGVGTLNAAIGRAQVVVARAQALATGAAAGAVATLLDAAGTAQGTGQAQVTRLEILSRALAREALLAGPVVVWTNLNMGGGSCLDADTLDGVHASDIFDAIAAEAAARKAADEALQAALDLEAQLRADGDARLANALAAEIAARTAAVAAEASARAAADEALRSALDAEAAARAAADDLLSAALDREISDRIAAVAAEAAARKAAIDAVRVSLDAEAAARAAADDALSAAIDAESQAREAAVEAEANARGAVVDALGAALDAEAKLRSDGDASLAGLLSAESAARKAADDALSTRAGKLEGHVSSGDFRGTSVVVSGGAGVGGRLGVGTGIPAPTIDLHVVSPASGAEDADILLQTGASGAKWFLTAANSGKFHVSDAQAGASRLVLDGAGNVGIGTSSPASTLDVAGDLRFTGTLRAGTVPWARLAAFPGSCANGQFVTSVGASLSCATPVGTTYSAGDGLALSGTTLRIPTGAVSGAMIADGTLTGADVLDGSLTGADVSPTTGLTVGSLWASSVRGGNFLVDPVTPASAGVARGIIGFPGYGVQHGQLRFVPGSGFQFLDSSCCSPEGGNDFPPIAVRTGALSATSLNAGGGSIVTTGSVGIGTSGPQSKLHVVADGPDDSGGHIRFENVHGGSGSNTNAQLIGKSSRGTVQMMVWEEHGARIGMRSATNGGRGDVFFTSGSDSTFLVGKANGNVGIGTQNPQTKLDVAGDARVSGPLTAGGVRMEQGNLELLTTQPVFSGGSTAHHRGGAVLIAGAAAYGWPSNVGYRGFPTHDAAFFLPVGNGLQESDLRLYVTDDYNDQFSIWGNTCGGGNCGSVDHAQKQFSFMMDGTFRARGSGLFNQGGNLGDIAEPAIGVGVEAGDVVVPDGFDALGNLRVTKSDAPYSKKVIGVVSTKPSITLAGPDGMTPVAISGIVPVKVVGAVEVGDLLVSSAVPGAAMACTEEPKCATGAVLGKALEAKAGDGAGSIRVLLWHG